MIKVTNDSNITFNVRYVRYGDKYGLLNLLTHTDINDDVVEFYDTRYDFDQDEYGNILGQFIIRYYTSTILKDREDGCGLCLAGGVDDWYITCDNINTVITFILENQSIHVDD